MDRAGLITLEQARGAGLSFAEPEPRTCPHCGAALDPLGAALAGRVAWVSAAPCPCEGAASEREAEARRRAALAAKEEAARREMLASIYFSPVGTAVGILDQNHPMLLGPNPFDTAWGSCNPGRPLS